MIGTFQYYGDYDYQGDFDDVIEESESILSGIRERGEEGKTET